MWIGCCVLFRIDWGVVVACSCCFRCCLVFVCDRDDGSVFGVATMRILRIPTTRIPMPPMYWQLTQELISRGSF